MRTAVITGSKGGIGLGVGVALNHARIDWHAFSRSEGHSVTCPHCINTLAVWASDYLICCHAADLGADFQEQITTDLVGAYNACMAVLPGMVERKFGRIVLLGSIRAAHPRPAGQVAYAAAKAGTEGLMRAIATNLEYSGNGITCNVVAPGAVDTPRTRANIAAGTVNETELLARTPRGKLTSVEEVASAVLYLCSDAAAAVNGIVFPVDGGWSISG